jgi:protein-tyrosine kinase
MKEKHLRSSSLFPSKPFVDPGISLNGSDRQPGTKRSIGEILVNAGVLTFEDTYRIVALQREKKIRFGEAAQALRLISEGDIRYALSYQYNYSYLPSSSRKLTNEELVAAYQPFSHEVDQLRAIRSQLMLQWLGKKKDDAVLAILSSGRAEGSSYLAANLAIVFAQMGERTLLIDADMRAPRQHSLFQLNNQLGFSSLLAGRSDLASVVMRISYIDNLDVLPAGPKPPNPQELLNRPTLNELFQYVRKTYDIVLIDTSSISSGADALIVGTKAGAALVVARANETKLTTFSQMIAELKRSQINVVGSVLNDPPLIDVAS